MGILCGLANSKRTLRSLGAFGAVIAAASFGACTKPTQLAAIASIQLQPGLDSIEIGETYNRWIITLRDANGNVVTGRALSWESQNTTVATIDQSGTVTGIGSGETLITATLEGKTAQAAIRVLKPVVSIVATPDSFDLPLGSSRAISVQLVGPGGLALTNRLITWSTSDPSVATVSTTGLVTPIAQGTVTVSINAGGKQASVRVRVVAEPVASVRITPQQSVHVVRLGQAIQLTAECLSATAQVLTGRTITWNSSNPLTATVGQTGLVSGNAIGQATITATCANVGVPNASAQVVAQVTQIPVSSATIAPSQLSLQVGQQGQLSVTARDSANNVLSLQGRSVTWTSDNLPVATVSNQGVVSGASAGSAQIQVTVDGVPSAPITATISSVPVATVTIGPLNPAVVCGQQIQLTATTRDGNGNILNGRVVTWSSANLAIATIGSATGIASGVAVGQVQITATSEGVPGFALLTVNAPQVGSCP